MLMIDPAVHQSGVIFCFSRLAGGQSRGLCIWGLGEGMQHTSSDFARPLPDSREYIDAHRRVELGAS